MIEDDRTLYGLFRRMNGAVRRTDRLKIRACNHAYKIADSGGISGDNRQF